MRVPIFKVVNDDDVNERPFAVSLQTLYENDPETFNAVAGVKWITPYSRKTIFYTLVPMCFNVTVGGGAAPQFTLTRIR